MNRFGSVTLAGVAALATFALYWPGASGVPFYNAPEPLEALVVREMVRTGDWVLPRRNGEEIPAKPPLYHWISAGMVTMTGRLDEGIVRLPSVLAGAATVGVVTGVAAWRLGAGVAIVAALVLASSPEWARWSLLARTDAVFVLCLTVALLFGERFAATRRSAFLVVWAAAAGAATLAKGPAGGLIPALALVLAGDGRAALRRAPWLAVVVAGGVFVGIAGSWYAAASFRGGFAFFHKQILLENVMRFLPHEGGPSRDHSVFYYVPAILVGMFPWSLALPAALVRPLRAGVEGDGGLGRRLLAWFAVVFVACTLASGKRSNYVLPLYPAAALLVGAWVDEAWSRMTVGSRRALLTIGVLASILLGLLAIMLGAWHFGFEPWRPLLPALHPRDREVLPLVATTLGQPPLAWPAALLVLAFSIAASLRFGNGRASVALLGLTMVLATWAGSAVVRPVEARLKTFEPFARRVARHLEPESPAAFYRKPEYGLLFYLERHVPVRGEDVVTLARRGWVFVWEEDWRALKPGARRRLRIVETSPPAAPHRPDSRLHLVRAAAPAARQPRKPSANSAMRSYPAGVG